MQAAVPRVLRAVPPVATSGRDRGDIVLGWLTRLTVVFAVVGLALFEAISIGTTTANVADQGSYAAQEASATWDQTRNAQSAYEAAVTAAVDQNAENVVSTKDFLIDPDGTVHLVISRDAKTLLLFRWHRTAGWAHVSRAAEGRSVQS